MCGIAGIAGRRDEALVRRMTDCMAHRGPDDAGVWADDNVTLGHRRLSIIDLSTGRQPMSNAEGTVWIVYNGEVYNFRELRAELEELGHGFRTQSDTEVLIAAWEAWGADCVARFQGMFAFALWDTEKKTLLLARDPIGVKPLYYARSGRTVCFASEIPALLKAPEVSREIDFEGVDDYLAFLYTVPPRTCFKDIRQLAPGQIALWCDGEWSERRYWRLHFEEESRNETEWIARIDAQLRETIGKYMIADVPLGAFLSGGLDSSAIVHYMRGQSSRQVQTFTIGFGPEGARYDEAAEARASAQFFGTDHHELTVASDLTALLPDIVRHFGEPFGNPMALLSHAISGLVRDHVTVVLSGDGGDESFGGYPRYAGARLAEAYRRVPALLRRWCVNPLVQTLPESTRGFHALRRLRAFSAGTLLSPVDMYAGWIGYYSAAERNALYTAETRRWVGDRDPFSFIRELAAESGTTDPVSRAMYIDLHSFLPHNVLQCGDRMSMAHSLEMRVPLADPELIKALAAVPSQFKIRGREGKTLLRRMLAGNVPGTVVRRGKSGFHPPMGVWLNTRLRPIVEDYLSEKNLKKHGYFNPAPVRRMIEDHRASRRDCTWHLWALLVFEEWRRQFID
jgi:asparagine synthase (glutamine-hydrolysing)